MVKVYTGALAPRLAVANADMGGSHRSESTTGLLFEEGAESASKGQPATPIPAHSLELSKLAEPGEPAKTCFLDGNKHSSACVNSISSIAAAISAPEVPHELQQSEKLLDQDILMPAQGHLLGRRLSSQSLTSSSSSSSSSSSFPRLIPNYQTKRSRLSSRGCRLRKIVDRLAEHTITTSEIASVSRTITLMAGARCRAYDHLYDHYRLCTLLRISPEAVVRKGETPKVVVTFDDDNDNDEYVVNTTSLEVAFKKGDRVMVSVALVDGNRDYVGVVTGIENISKYRVWFDDDATTLTCASSEMRYVSILEFPLPETSKMPVMIRQHAEFKHDLYCYHCLMHIAMSDTDSLNCLTCTYSCHKGCLDLEDPASALTWPMRPHLKWQCSACCLDPALKVGALVVAKSNSHNGTCPPCVVVSGNTLLKIRKRKVKSLKHQALRLKNREQLMGLKKFLLGYGFLINEYNWKCLLNGDHANAAPNIFVDSLRAMNWIGHSGVLNAIESGVLPCLKRVPAVIWPIAKAGEGWVNSKDLKKKKRGTRRKSHDRGGGKSVMSIISQKRKINEVNDGPPKVRMGRNTSEKKTLKKKKLKIPAKKRKVVIISSSEGELYPFEEISSFSSSSSPSSLSSSSSSSQSSLSSFSDDSYDNEEDKVSVNKRVAHKFLTKPVPIGAICFLCQSGKRKDLYYWQKSRIPSVGHFWGGIKSAKLHLPNLKESNQQGENTYCHLKCRCCCQCGKYFSRYITSRMIMCRSKLGFVCTGCTPTALRKKVTQKNSARRKKDPPRKKQRIVAKCGSSTVTLAKGRTPTVLRKKVTKKNSARRKTHPPQKKQRKAAKCDSSRATAEKKYDEGKFKDEQFYLEYPGEDRTAQSGFKGVKEIIDTKQGNYYEARVGSSIVGVFGTAEEAARARDMSLVVRAYRMRKAGNMSRSNDPARSTGLNFPKSVIASLYCDTCFQSFDSLGGIFGLIQHQDEGICKKIFNATEDYAKAKSSAERAAAVQKLNILFQLPQSRIEEGWVLNEDPSQRVRLRRVFENMQSGDGSIFGTAVAVLLHPLDGFYALMLHDDGDMEDLNREEFDLAKRNFYDEKCWLDPLDPMTMEHVTMQDNMSLSQTVVEIRERYGIGNADVTVEMLLHWNKFVAGEKLRRNARLKQGTTIWFRNPAP